MKFKRPDKQLLAVFAAIALATASPTGIAFASVELQSDDFDTDIAGWSAAGASGSQVAWDGSTGFPSPGSLRLSTAGGASDESFKAAGQCLPAEANRVYSVEAHIDPDLGDRSGACFALPVFFDEPDCQGEGSVTGTGDVVSEGQWQRRVRMVSSFGSSRSVRTELVMTLSTGTGVAACHFDAVRLHEGRLVEPVPALALPGLVMLCAALLAGAVMRRRGTA